MAMAMGAFLLCGYYLWQWISYLPLAYNEYGAFHPNFAGKLLGTFDWALAMGNLLYFVIRRRTHVEMLRAMDGIST
jgi:hypothetical protein